MDLLTSAKADQTQIDFMNKDMVILVDENDKVLGKGTKLETHLISNISKGMLHRAFSVFLFNTKGELLLQQRASEKITFPDMWTNTYSLYYLSHITSSCCSHPLYISTELDGVSGVKNAAIRKLEHELGIDSKTFTPEDFTFMTRIHYKAASQDPKWGEHEGISLSILSFYLVDYVLIAQKDVVCDSFNKNEVRAVKWLSQESLKSFFKQGEDPKSGVVITPWCRIIVENFVYKWWDHLDSLSKYVDVKTVHKLKARL